MNESAKSEFHKFENAVTPILELWERYSLAIFWIERDNQRYAISFKCKLLSHDAAKSTPTRLSAGKFHGIRFEKPIGHLVQLLQQLQSGLLDVDGKAITFGSFPKVQNGASDISFNFYTHIPGASAYWRDESFAGYVVNGVGHDAPRAFEETTKAEDLNNLLRLNRPPFTNFLDLVRNFIGIDEADRSDSMHFRLEAEIPISLPRPLEANAGCFSYHLAAPKALQWRHLSGGLVYTTTSKNTKRKELTFKWRKLRGRDNPQRVSRVNVGKIAGAEVVLRYKNVIVRIDRVLPGTSADIGPFGRIALHLDPNYQKLATALTRIERNDDFEEATAALLALCEYKSVLLGGTEAFKKFSDILAIHPSSKHLLLVECTTGIPSQDKIAKLYQRYQSTSALSLRLPVVAVLACPFPAKEVPTAAQDLAKLGMLIFTSEDLLTLLRSAQSFDSKSSLYDLISRKLKAMSPDSFSA